MSRPPDPFDNVRVAMLEKDAQGERIYPPRHPPDSADTPESTTAPQGSPPGPTEEAAGRYQQTEPHDPELPLRSNYRSTPFSQRDYVDSTSTVQGKFGGNHTRIRPDKWRKLSDRYCGNPKGYNKALKKLRYRDNKDKRIQAQNQAAAAAAVASEAADSQAAWGAQ